jgi:sodium/bile acid cotransporter 7
MHPPPRHLCLLSRNRTIPSLHAAGVAAWRSRNRQRLSYLSAVCLAMVPWMQVSRASSLGLSITTAALASAAAASITLHLIMLAGNLTATRLLSFSPDAAQNVAIRKAVVLCASEKTLPVAVAVLTQLSDILGAGMGFAVIPCVMAHLLQIIIDSAVVSRWNEQELRQAKLAAA